MPITSPDEPRDPVKDAAVAAYGERQRELGRIRAESRRAEFEVWDQPMVEGPERVLPVEYCDVCQREMTGRCCL